VAHDPSGTPGTYRLEAYTHTTVEVLECSRRPMRTISSVDKDRDGSVSFKSTTFFRSQRGTILPSSAANAFASGVLLFSFRRSMLRCVAFFTETFTGKPPAIGRSQRTFSLEIVLAPALDYYVIPQDLDPEVPSAEL